MNSFLLVSAFTLLSLSLTAQPSDKHFWHQLETSASPEIIWSIWTNVENWHEWDKGLQKAVLESDQFSLNAKGVITSLENRKSKFKVVEFEEGRSYTFKTKLPLASLYVKRYLEQKNGKTYFTHEVWFKGLLAGVFAKNFGPEFRAMLPGVMENIKIIVESSN